MDDMDNLDWEKERGIHITSAHNNHIILAEGEYTITTAQGNFSSKDATILIIPNEVQIVAELKKDSRKVLAELVGELKIEAAECYIPSRSDDFLYNKMKWKKPRWQR